MNTNESSKKLNENLISSSQTSSYKIGDEIILDENFLKTPRVKECSISIREKFLGNHIANKKPTNFGAVKVFCYNDINPIISIGPDYSMTIILYLLIFSSFICSIIFLFPNIEVYLSVISYIIYSILIISFSLTVLKNPGFPGREYYFSKEIEKNISNSDNYLICYTCNVYVKDDVKIGHCLTCNICIIGYDHHCGWSSKCIGTGNMLFFRIFTISLLIVALYNVGLIVYCKVK